MIDGVTHFGNIEDYVFRSSCSIFLLFEEISGKNQKYVQNNCSNFCIIKNKPKENWNNYNRSFLKS